MTHVTRWTAIAGLAVLASACGGSKEAPAASDAAPPAVAETLPVPPAPDSMKAPSGTAAAPNPQVPPGTDPKLLRDSAFGPKFTVDSNGKVVPIKRP